MAVALLLIAFMLSGLKLPFYYALFSSAIESLLIVVLGIKVLSVTGLSIAPLMVKVPAGSFFGGALGVGFVMVGGGVTFFLGYEAEGKGRTVGKSYLFAYLVSSLLVLFASYYEVAAAGYTSAGVGHLLSITQFPGFYLAKKYMGQPFSYAVLAFTITSLMGSALAAYVALSRLTHVMLRKSMLTSIAAIGVFFFVINLVGSITGNLVELYLLSTEASIVTLYASHIITSVAFPLFTSRIKAKKFYDIILSISTVVLMGYGIYSNMIPYEFPISAVGVVSLLAGILLGIITGYRLVSARKIPG